MSKTRVKANQRETGMNPEPKRKVFIVDEGGVYPTVKYDLTRCKCTDLHRTPVKDHFNQ